MKISILSLVVSSILLPLETVGISSENAPPLHVSENHDWIYFRQDDIYFYLLTTDDLSKAQRALFQQKAYAFFFEYWTLHRASHATLPPVERFEQSFARMLKKYAMPFLDADDPLNIRPFYIEGRFVRKNVPKLDGVTIPEAALLPQIQGVPSEDLKTWTGYQRYVSDFRKFFASASAPPKR